MLIIPHTYILILISYSLIGFVTLVLLMYDSTDRRIGDVQ
jgi:hypothetical protein